MQSRQEGQMRGSLRLGRGLCSLYGFFRGRGYGGCLAHIGKISNGIIDRVLRVPLNYGFILLRIPNDSFKIYASSSPCSLKSYHEMNPIYIKCLSRYFSYTRQRSIASFAEGPAKMPALRSL